MTEWQDRAACAGQTDYDTFFPAPDDIRTIRKAKSICGGCPVKQECLLDALAWPVNMDFGIRGGLTDTERLEMRAGLPEPPCDGPGHPGHGTTEGYTYEIRYLGQTCEGCRDAEARYRRGLRDNANLTPGDPRHGKRSTYTVLACRCELCSAAQSAYRTSREQQRRARERRAAAKQ